MVLSITQMAAKNIFVVEGPEETYNQIRVVNETSHPNFNCRIVVLNDDESTQRVYGVFNLNGRETANSQLESIERGTKLGIQLPKDLPDGISFYVEYKDYPIFDFIIIHLIDSTSEFNED